MPIAVMLLLSSLAVAVSALLFAALRPLHESGKTKPNCQPEEALCWDAPWDVLFEAVLPKVVAANAMTEREASLSLEL